MVNENIFSQTAEDNTPSGAQTLLRGLAVLEHVANGITDVKRLVSKTGAPRSTVHRILSSLVSEGYLHHIPYQGYTLGYKLIFLGSCALEQRPLSQIAQPFLEELATMTGDTVHLGIPDKSDVLYLNKVSGGKGLEMRSRIGQKMPLATTGLGKALMLGMKPEQWKHCYDDAMERKNRIKSDYPKLQNWPEYREIMLTYKKQGWVKDLEENELGIRCVGAPVRDANDTVIAAVSIASAIFYMPEERMDKLGPVVLETANKISQIFGRTEPSANI